MTKKAEKSIKKSSVYWSKKKTSFLNQRAMKSENLRNWISRIRPRKDKKVGSNFAFLTSLLTNFYHFEEKIIIIRDGKVLSMIPMLSYPPQQDDSLSNTWYPSTCFFLRLINDTHFPKYVIWWFILLIAASYCAWGNYNSE